MRLPLPLLLAVGSVALECSWRAVAITWPLEATGQMFGKKNTGILTKMGFHPENPDDQDETGLPG